MKIKVGDRVIAEGEVGNIQKINIGDKTDKFPYKVEFEDHTRWFGKKELEPITKTLDDLEVGDILFNGYWERLVIDVSKNGKLFGLSEEGDFEMFGEWDTLEEIKKSNYKLKDSEELEPKVKKAIKLLEEKGYKVEK